MKKSVIYTRFSPGGKQNAQSIEGQLKVCREFATREGYHIVTEYCDEKTTGKSAEKRVEFQRMIADAARGNWQYVLVYQLDRFSRNKYDNAIYKEKLSRSGVTVISAMENINIEDASGILMETMLEGMAAYYSKELSQKIMTGREINASKFLSLGARPGLGYKVVDRQIVIDETNAAHVVRIFEMYANGSTMSEIIELLNSLGIKSWNGNNFSKNSLSTILRNKRYIGTYTYKGTETPDVLPQIVPKPLFDQVQRRLADNVKSGGRGKAVETYILSGKLFCGHCLSSMVSYGGTSRTGKLYSYYKEKSKNCKDLKVAKRLIEDKVIEKICEIALTEDNQRIIAKEISALCEKELDNPNLIRLQKLIKENNKQKANLLESLKVGNASATAANYVFSEIDRLEKELADLEQNAAVEEDSNYGLSEVDIMFFLSQLKKQCGDLDNIENRKLLVNVLVNSVYLYEDGNKATIIFNVNNQPPVEVDVELLNEISEHGKRLTDRVSKLDKGSNTDRLSPPYQYI